MIAQIAFGYGGRQRQEGYALCPMGLAGRKGRVGAEQNKSPANGASQTPTGEGLVGVPRFERGTS